MFKIGRIAKQKKKRQIPKETNKFPKVTNNVEKKKSTRSAHNTQTTLKMIDNNAPPYLCLQCRVLLLHFPECRGVIMPQCVGVKRAETPTQPLPVATKQNVHDGTGTV